MWPKINYNAYKLIVSDLDGTLKDMNQPLDPDLPVMIERLAQAGISFTIATGKNLKSTKSVAQALGISMPLVLCNGCILQEVDGTVIEKHLLPYAFTQRLIAICSQEGIELAIHIGEDIYVEAITYNVSLLYDYDSPNLVEVGQWSHVPDLLSEAYKCLAIDRNDRQRLFALEEKVFAIAGDSVEYCHTLIEMLEFMPVGVSKVSGIQSLAQARDIPMDAILAMGDGNNDISMLREAGFAVAVSNAPQAVRDVADWIIPPCAEDGPKHFLGHILQSIKSG